MTGIIIAVAVTLVVTVPSAFVIGVSHRKKQAEKDLESAENRAKKVVEDAKQDAERIKKDALIEAKDEVIKQNCANCRPHTHCIGIRKTVIETNTAKNHFNNL